MNETLTPADISAVVGNDRGGGFGGNSAWVLIILFALIFMFGRGGFGGNGGGGGVTEADLCSANSFNELKSSVGRLSDQLSNNTSTLQTGLCDIGYENLRNINETQRIIQQGNNDLSRQIADGNCRNERMLLENRYEAEKNTSRLAEKITADTQKILDVMCRNREAELLGRINQLERQVDMQGIVRYPTSMAYNAGQSPFCGNYCCGQY